MLDSRKSAYSSRNRAVTEVAAVAREAGRADQAGDIGRQRRGRVAGVFLPSLLRRWRAFSIRKCAARSTIGYGSKCPRGARLVQPPRQHDRKRDFVELDAGPVGSAVDPEILREAAVGSLRAGEVDERAQRGGDVAAGRQAGRAVDHVARPDQMVAAQVFVALDLAPRDAERSDQRARDRSCLRARAAIRGCGDRARRRRRRISRAAGNVLQARAHCSRKRARCSRKGTPSD